MKWFPSHVGTDVSELADNHNETANSVARELSGRAAETSLSAELWAETKDRMGTFHEITKYYRMNRRVMAPPHPDLTREQAALFRQLQTGSLLTPVIMKHICPEQYPDDTCKVCRRARATMIHILWDCAARPAEAETETVIPPWLQDAARSYNKEDQLLAVQQILEALERQRPSESCEASATPRGNGD